MVAAGFQASIARADAYVAVLRERKLIDRPILSLAKKFADTRGGLIRTSKGVNASELRAAERALKTKLPASYVEMAQSFGRLEVFRSNPEERLIVFAPRELAEQRARVERALRKAFAGYAERFRELARAYGRPRPQARWRIGDTFILSPDDLARLVFVPFATYYDGAFGFATSLADESGEAPVLCWVPDPEPEAFVFYGRSAVEWFSAMVDWSIQEIDALIASER